MLGLQLQLHVDLGVGLLLYELDELDLLRLVRPRGAALLVLSDGAGAACAILLKNVDLLASEICKTNKIKAHTG